MAKKKSKKSREDPYKKQEDVKCVDVTIRVERDGALYPGCTFWIDSVGRHYPETKLVTGELTVRVGTSTAWTYVKLKGEHPGGRTFFSTASFERLLKDASATFVLNPCDGTD